MTAAEQPSLHDEDFYAWTRRTADLLRSGRGDEIDAEHVAEEIEDMGKRDARQLKSRTCVLLLHLLKWQLQPQRRPRSWKATIGVQRQKIEAILADSPSLRRKLAETLDGVYRDAVERAVDETGLAEAAFPAKCPYSFDQILTRGFLPQ